MSIVFWADGHDGAICARDAGWFVRLLFADALDFAEGLFDRFEVGEYLGR